MATRNTKYRTHSHLQYVLADGEEAVINQVAFLDVGTGELYAGATSETLLPNGYFTKTLTGDGELVAKVRLFREVKTEGFKNDTAPNNVAAADIGSEVYFKDGETVSTLATGRSKAGRVIKIVDGLVYIEGGLAVTGPTGATGADAVADIVTQARIIPLDLATFCLGDGTFPAWADGSADGVDVDGGEVVGIRWNPAGDDSYDVFYKTVPVPPDLDGTEDVIVHLLAAKVGATIGDAVTFDVGAFFNVTGALYDADTNAGGVSSAMTGNATSKTVQHETRTIAAADVPDNALATPSTVTITVKPTEDTLQTDDVILIGAWLEYTPKLAA